MKQNIAFFDFDGTITKDDSLLGFIRMAVGDVRFVWGFIVLLPLLICYKLGIVSNNRAKQMLIKHFFAGYKKDDFASVAKSYSLTYIPKILRPKAMEKIAWHKANGDQVVVVSASIDCWLRPWCEANDLHLIATKLEIENGLISGRFATANCFGAEKVNRIKAEFDLSNYSEIFAYGDSKGDKEMLAIADQSFYKPFRD